MLIYVWRDYLFNVIKLSDITTDSKGHWSPVSSASSNNAKNEIKYI